MSAVVVADFLPPGKLEQAVELFESAVDWRHVVFEDAYCNRLIAGANMPLADETYRTSFDQSSALEHDAFVASIVKLIGGTAHHCYRMTAGDGLRLHSDAYFEGEGAANLYLNRNWAWDWGGLLHVIDGGCHTFCPSLNTLVRTAYAPHFVSPVAPWAQQPRYVLAIFGVKGIR